MINLRTCIAITISLQLHNIHGTRLTNGHARLNNTRLSSFSQFHHTDFSLEIHMTTQLSPASVINGRPAPISHFMAKHRSTLN